MLKQVSGLILSVTISSFALILNVTLLTPAANAQSANLVSVSQTEGRIGMVPNSALDKTAVSPLQRNEQLQIARSIAERQVQLRTDTEKLAALAAELKKQVDKTGFNILSLEVIKKAAEIQKLAKSVQDKMKNAY